MRMNLNLFLLFSLFLNEAAILLSFVLVNIYRTIYKIGETRGRGLLRSNLALRFIYVFITK